MLTYSRMAVALLVAATMPSIASPGVVKPSSRVTAISFRFEPATIGDKKSFHVQVRFRASEAVTSIVVPSSYGGAAHLEGQTQNLKVLTSGATLEDDAEPGEKKLHAHTGDRIELTYDIVPLQTEWFAHPQEHMAIINADYFLFNPENALVYPDLPRTGLVDATFDWRALPAGTPLFSSFGDGRRLLRVRQPWYKVTEAIFAGGNFRAIERQENGTTLVLAVRGNWKFSDQEAFTQLRRILDEENKFWHTQAMPFFLVTLAPFDEKSGDNDGSGFTNAYMLFLSHEDTFDSERVRLLAHEMFHHWNPMSMGPVTGDESVQWFTEGGTVYYEAIIPLRAGLISYAEYLTCLNRRLFQYQRSPLRNITNADWQKLSHASGPGYDLSYARGAAIALWADAAIREHTQSKSSLDSVMLDLVSEAQTPQPPELSEDRVFSTFARYLAPQQLAQLRAIAVEGADVPLPQTLGSCARLEHVAKTVVDTGFDEQKSIAAKRIVGVDPAGPAYKAGIRDGQELLRYSIDHDDPSKDVRLGVMIEGKREQIEYSPAKQQEIWQYQASSAAESCNPF